MSQPLVLAKDPLTLAVRPDRLTPSVVRLGDRSHPRQLTLIVHISGSPADAPAMAANVVDALRTAVEQPPAALTVVDFPADQAAADLRISVGARRVAYRGRPIAFTRLEFDLLVFLCEHPHRVHRRSTLLGQVWKFPSNSPSERTIDIHVRRLRKKLGPEFDLISTVRGIGYRLDPRNRVDITD